MTNGQPQTDRELLIEINTKLTEVMRVQGVLFDKDKEKEHRLQSLELNREAQVGLHLLENQRLQEMQIQLDSQPSAVKAVVWTGIITGTVLSAVNTAFALWKG